MPAALLRVEDLRVEVRLSRQSVSHEVAAVPVPDPRAYADRAARRAVIEAGLEGVDAA